MGFEQIENVAPPAPSVVPTDGVCIRARALTRAAKMGGGTSRFLTIIVGAALVRKLALPDNLAEVPVALGFGTGADAGKLAIWIDAKGGFLAKANKVSVGTRRITLSAATCDGLFALDFAAVAIAAVPVLHRQGQPPMAVIALPAALLAAD